MSVVRRSEHEIDSGKNVGKIGKLQMDFALEVMEPCFLDRQKEKNDNQSHKVAVNKDYKLLYEYKKIHAEWHSLELLSCENISM